MSNRSAKKKLPAHIAARLAERGVDPEGILRHVHGDMDLQHGFVDQILAYDAEKLYILSGTEKVVHLKKENRLEAVFDPTGFSEIPVSELGKLSVDQMISQGRLISEKDGVFRELADFSIGRTANFEIFARNFNRSFGEDEEDSGPIGEEQELFCPKCGTRYPDPARKLCPKCMSRTNLAGRLMSLFKKYTFNVIMIVFLILLQSAFSILSPYFSTALIYDKVLAGAPGPDTVYYGVQLFHEAGLVILGLIAIRVVGVLLNIVRSNYMASTVPKVIYDMKMLIFTAMQRLSVGFYTSKQTGSLMTRVNDDANNVYNFFFGGVPYLVSSVLTFGGVLTVMMLINWKLCLIVAVSIPVILGSYVGIMRFLRRLYRANWVYNSRMNSLLSDALYGQRIIKAFTQEDSESARFESYSRRVQTAHTRLALTQNTAYPLVGLVMRIAQCVLLAFGTVLVLRREMSVGILLTLSAYLNMLFEPLGLFSSISNWWSSCLDSAQRIFEIADAKTDLPEAEHPVHLETIRGDFKAEGLLFEYEPGHPIVRDLNLEVKGGQMLGIVGKTGAGKSTLINLLARLYDPVEGVITLDGVNIKDIAIEDLRRNIGIVSQDIYLFIGSIADNIRYARPDATLDEVIRAARAACAHDFISKLPDGYETRVGAGGQGLSGGERQRISIARAIIQNPSILILDEATAAMDTETERRIQESLAALQKGRTTIAIAHRLSTLRDADVLAVIDKGRVVEYGTHSELIALENGTYRKLYDLQMEALKMIAG
ncbi:MAG: ATP-binding cassette domain-containing protein [Oscillospiraceae bacterium]|nr:ATP-binding cassette domain-containing protein [Oscillospiraceae bacterium]